MENLSSRKLKVNNCRKWDFFMIRYKNSTIVMIDINLDVGVRLKIYSHNDDEGNNRKKENTSEESHNVQECFYSLQASS